MPLFVPSSTSTLIASKIITVDASLVSLEDFSVDVNAQLVLRSNIIGLAGANAILKPNGDTLVGRATINLNNGSTLAASGISKTSYAELANNASHFSAINITFFNGLFMYLGSTMRRTAADRYDTFGGRGVFITTTLTSLDIFADDGTGSAITAIGIGSTFDLYALT